MDNWVRSIIPDQIKSIIQSSKIYDQWYNNYHAKKLASSSKRLDLCAAEVANYLFLSGVSEKYPLRNKVCLELGSGWVLSHSLVLYLLGAKKVYATDVSRLLHPAYISTSVHSAVDYIIWDCLAGFEDHDLIRVRLDKLRSVNSFSIESLKDFGIEYIAPVDLAHKPLGIKVDFIFSKSVLEHVPVSDVVPLLKNITTDLTADGMMFHLIHLEDHKNITNQPFDFLSESKEVFSRDIQSARGNRLRRSTWQHIFSSIKDLDYQFVFEWSRKDKKIPEIIDSSINYIDEDDIRVSHIGVCGKKKVMN